MSAPAQRVVKIPLAPMQVHYVTEWVAAFNRKELFEAQEAHVDGALLVIDAYDIDVFINMIPPRHTHKLEGVRLRKAALHTLEFAIKRRRDASTLKRALAWVTDSKISSLANRIYNPREFGQLTKV